MLSWESAFWMLKGQSKKYSWEDKNVLKIFFLSKLNIYDTESRGVTFVLGVD